MAEATVPFQPTYSLTPKYGLRYGPSQFTTTTGIPGAGSATSQSVNQPASLGAGAGANVVDPFANSTQFQQAQANYSGQGGVSSTSGYGAPIQSRGVTGGNTGFRSNSYTYAAPPSIPTAPDYFNPTPTTPVVKDPFAGDPAFSQGNDGQSNSTPDYSNVASGLGYTKSPASLAGLAGLVPVVGPMIAGGMESNYGKPGTYDAQGNVFGDEGRAYNPVTGTPVASYANRETALNTVTGGYDKLREAGTNPIASALGSYENSINNVSRTDRFQGYTPSGKTGYNSMVDELRLNEGLEDDDRFKTTSEMQVAAFGREIPNYTNVMGTNVGDTLVSGDTGAAYVVGNNGSISNADGTLISSTNPVTGEKVSLMTSIPGGGFTSKGANTIVKNEQRIVEEEGEGYNEAEDSAGVISNDVGGFGGTASGTIDYGDGDAPASSNDDSPSGGK